MHVLRQLPEPLVNTLTKPTFDDDVGRELAVQLLRQPTYARNFFELGTEELRDVPESIDVRIKSFCNVLEGHSTTNVRLFHYRHHRFATLESIVRYLCFMLAMINGLLIFIKTI